MSETKIRKLVMILQTYYKVVSKKNDDLKVLLQKSDNNY